MTAGDQCGSCSVDLAAAVARAFLEERTAVLATLIRQAGDFQLAEDALQDAFADAITAWQRDGIPASPGAWITAAARRRTIDRLRRDRSIADRAVRLAELARLGDGEDAGAGGDHTIADDRLRLIFTCCHPALDVSARVALTLRVQGGIARPALARIAVARVSATAPSGCGRPMGVRCLRRGSGRTAARRSAHASELAPRLSRKCAGGPGCARGRPADPVRDA